MPRTARASVGGICYHVINRGNVRGEVFHKPEDYAAFRQLLREATGRVGAAHGGALGAGGQSSTARPPAEVDRTVACPLFSPFRQSEMCGGECGVEHRGSRFAIGHQAAAPKFSWYGGSRVLPSSRRMERTLYRGAMAYTSLLNWSTVKRTCFSMWDSVDRLRGRCAGTVTFNTSVGRCF